MKGIITLIASLLLLGCGKTHHRTDKICEGKFYVEFYSDWSDMGVCYLTDSVNFRVKVVRFNQVGEYFRYRCKPDSLIIELWSGIPLPEHTLTTKAFNIKKIMEDGKFDN